MNPPGRVRIALVVAILAVAIGLRITTLVQIRTLGFVNQPTSDARIYDQRAREIAGGDWLGPANFVHAPLYAYFVGLVYLVNDGPWLLRVLQVLGGTLACLLLYLATRRWFDQRVALLAALGLAIYPPAIFFDVLLQKTSLAVLLCTLLLWLYAISSARPSWWRWLLAGIALGLLILTRQNALILVPLLLIGAFFAGEKPTATKRRAAWCAVTLVGVALTLLLWAARNRAVIGSCVLTTPNLGQNFAMGNHPDATGTYLPFQRGRATAEHEQQAWTRAAETAAGHELSPREVSDYYLRSAVDWIRANPGAWLRLTGKKLLMTWGAYEPFDTEDYYLYQRYVPLLRWLDTIFHFGVLAPLALAGVVLTWPDRRRLWFLSTWLALNTLAVAAFVVFARYRMPLVPVLMMLAAAGLLRGAESIRTHRWPHLSVAILVLAIAALAANLPTYQRRVPTTTSFVNHAVALADQHQYDRALGELEQALKLSPDDVDAHFTRGTVLLDLGRPADAGREFARVAKQDPSYAAVHRGMGDASLALGQPDGAIEYYERARQLDPQDPVTLRSLAAAYAQADQGPAALELLHQTLKLAPTDAETYLNLGNTHLSMGHPAEAVAAYEHALELRPACAEALHNLGVVLAQRGDLEAARERFEAALQADPTLRQAQVNLVQTLTVLGRTAEARHRLDEFLKADPQRPDLLQLRAALPKPEDK